MNLFVVCLNLLILLIQTSDERSIMDLDFVPKSRNDIIYEIPPMIRTRAGEQAIDFGELYIKIAIFYDKYLLIRFGGDVNVLKRFVSSLVHTSQIYYNRDNMRSFVKLQFLVVYFEEYPDNTNYSTGEVPGFNTKTLSDFCAHQKSIVGILTNNTGCNKWDAAMLLTSLNLWSSDSKKMDGDLGMSYQDTISTESACGIVETREFVAANIFAHELGHILRLKHDGESGCKKDKFIMTALFGFGRINEWSECSAIQLNQKLTDMKNSMKLPCLTQQVAVVSPEFDFPKQKLPGLEWPVDKQCQFNLGAKYRAITTDKYNDICQSLHCRSMNNWHDRKFGFPALEGTYCGSKWTNGKELRHHCHSVLCTTKVT